MLLFMMFACRTDAISVFDADATFIQVGSTSDGLNVPRDLAFNPAVPGELWVVNRADDSVSVFHEAGTEEQSSEHIIDPFALHFMEEVSSIAFGKPFHFGTCQESRNTYNNQYQGDNFMGPTLWHSDLEVFGESNPEAVEYLSNLHGTHVDLGSHVDMLHESPLCMGITWERDNIYWVFDGSNQSIARYDFQEDHGVGFDDHSDGIIAKYVTGEIERVPDVPSHISLHHPSGMIYVADSGNNAIKRLDITSGEPDRNLPVVEPGTRHFSMKNARFETVVNGADHGMVTPSGLSIIDETIIVGDNSTGILYQFDFDGNLMGTFETGVEEGGLMGLYSVSADDIWYVDAAKNELWRIQSGTSEPFEMGDAGEY